MAPGVLRYHLNRADLVTADESYAQLIAAQRRRVCQAISESTTVPSLWEANARKCSCGLVYW
jgi:hypothetical protein